MSWQDIIFTVASVGFSIALIPAVLSSQKPPRSSCLMTGFFLWLFVPTYLSLDLRYSAITGASTALLWTILLFQRRPDLPLDLGTGVLFKL